MKTENAEGGTLETWTPDETAAALKEGRIVLIDVRTPQEFAFERVGGAFLMPMSDFDASFLPEEGGKQLVFHCGSGVRSEKVARQALAAGRGRVAHVEGGFGAWKAAKLPHITTDMATGAPKRAP